MNQESIIGKTYIPQDNSYATCLTNEKGVEKLLCPCPANNNALNVMTILSEPMQLKFKSIFKDRVQGEFILVKDEYDEHVYCVLWNINGLLSK